MQSEREKMLAGELYNSRDPELIAARERARSLTARINTSAPDDPEQRKLLIQLLGSGGQSATVTAPFFCDYGANIHLGEDVYFNFNCVLLDVCPIRIGAHTLVGPAVQIYTPLHPLDPALRRQQEYGKPVHIGHDAWIGGGSVILPGVHIGERAVIGAGSVVTGDIPGDVLAAGNPCKVIRKLA